MGRQALYARNLVRPTPNCSKRKRCRAPPLIISEETQAHGIEDCLEMLRRAPFDPADEQALAHGAKALKRLANIRSTVRMDPSRSFCRG